MSPGSGSYTRKTSIAGRHAPRFLAILVTVTAFSAHGTESGWRARRDRGHPVPIEALRPVPSNGASWRGDERVIDLSGTDVRSVSYLPASLEVLDVSGTGVTSLSYLPAGLRVLRLARTAVSSLSYLPAALEVLDVSSTPITSLSYLPKSLLVLGAARTRVSSLSYLPKALVALDVSGSAVSTLYYLPASLRYLDVRRSDVRSLDWVPGSVACVVADAPLHGPNVVRSPRDCRLPRWIREVVSR